MADSLPNCNDIHANPLYSTCWATAAIRTGAIYCPMYTSVVLSSREVPRSLALPNLMEMKNEWHILTSTYTKQRKSLS